MGGFFEHGCAAISISLRFDQPGMAVVKVFPFYLVATQRGVAYYGGFGRLGLPRNCSGLVCFGWTSVFTSS